MATWTVNANNDAALTLYISMRAAQDHVTLTADQAISELLVMGGIDPATGESSGPAVKPSGNIFGN